MSLILLAKRRFADFRAATLAVITCFFLGYALYVIFPAAPPRLVLVSEYTKNLYGYPQFFSSLNAEAFSLLPVDSRAAFPSLHTAVSVVMLAGAWRYLRGWFWIALPLAVGLWVSTIYLRHHYVVDLLAGFALAPVALWAAPRLDRWWAAVSARWASLPRAAPPAEIRPARGGASRLPRDWRPPRSASCRKGRRRTRGRPRRRSPGRSTSRP